MIFDVIQTGRDLFAARFMFRREDETVGEAFLQGQLGSMEASIRGTYYDTEFAMSFGKKCDWRAGFPALSAIRGRDCMRVGVSDGISGRFPEKI